MTHMGQGPFGPVSGLDLDTVEGFRELIQRIDAIHDRRWNRALAMAHRAGVSDLGELHRAIDGESRGRPWQGVDYKIAHEARRLVAGYNNVGITLLDRAVKRMIYANNQEGG